MLFVIPAILAPMLLAIAPPANTAGIAVESGNVVFHDATGEVHRLTSDGGYIQPLLSPDRTRAVFVHVEKPGTPGYGDARTSIWIADLASGTKRCLMPSTPRDEPTSNLAAMWKPRFSPDGATVYVMAEGWVTSPAIHAIDTASGRDRFFAAGELVGVIANGRWRGHLILFKRRYLPGPERDFDVPAYVASPDGRQWNMIRGSARGDGEAAVNRWLQARGARRL